MDSLLIQYLPILMVLGIATAGAVAALAASWIVARQKPDPEKSSAYECGFEPFDEARACLLSEIGGTAAYRVVDRTAIENLNAPGALGSAIERLRRESVSMRDVARMPGMNIERAARLLNALYLTSSLMVTRTNPAARSEPGLLRGLFGSGKARR